MQLVDRIEKRRFVGREYLLWLWFESELLEATVHTKQHGELGLWLENRLTLSYLKESTKITAPMPGLGPEAKAALRRGQLPESAGIRIAYKDSETRLTFHAERLAITGLRLATVLDQEEEEEPNLLLEAHEKRRKNKGRTSAEMKADMEAEQGAEIFYERMRLTTEIEEILSTLYYDFLAMRLSSSWNKDIVPILRRFANEKPIDADDYSALRRKLLRASSKATAASS